MPIGTPHGTLDYKQVSKVTFVGASSNTVIDTTTGSLGVGVGVGGPTSNLHVVGNAFISSDLTVSGNVSDLNVVSNVNMLHTGNTAAIKLNSNVVTEFPRSKKFIKYPRVALTSAAQTGSGYEGYFVSQDSATLTGTSDRQAWALFDNVLAGAGPHFDGSGARYDNSGIYTGGDSLGGISGDWAYIRLPDKIQLHSVDLWARYNDIRNPIDATVMGSLNGTNWSVLGSWKNAKFAAGKSTSFNLNSIQYYNYIGFVFEKIEANSSGGYVNFHEIELFGTPEYDPEAHGTDVTVKSYPNVPNTDGLERYYDAKNYSYGSTILDELTATHRDATINGSVPLDTSSGINSWSFNGNTSNFISGDDNVDGIPPGGDWVHSMSIWFKTTDMSNDQNIAMILPSAYLNGGSLATGSASAFYLRGKNSGTSPNHLQIVHWSQDVRINYIFNEDEWYHLTYAYSGGGVSSASQHTYINGVHVPLLESTRSSSTAGDPLNTSSVSRVVLGKRYLTGNEKPFTGSIANFRLFNRALTSDEIYQLYAYQKEYFGHGDLSMTLKAGRLGIGTSEPMAALDVRGDIYAVGSVNPVIGMWKQSISSATVTTNILTNIGSCVSITTAYRRSTMSGSHGLFTAPYDGIYQFQAFLIGQSTGSNCLLVFGANGPSVDNNTWDSKNLINSYNELFELRGNVDFEEVMTFATLLNMSKGDTVNIQNHSSTYLGLNDLRCSVFLLHRFN